MKYTQINYQDRVTIEIQLKRWAKQKEIAEVIGKSPWTVSREIRRNSVTKKWSRKKEYLANDAEMKTYQRRRWAKMQSMKINMNSKLKLFIIEQIQKTDILPSPKVIAWLWNQEQIEKGLKENKDKISHMSIYKWLEIWDWNKYKEFLAHNFKWYKKRKHQTQKVKIKNRVWIELRSELISNREEQWHLEADLVVSKKGFKWALLTLIDRKTRLPRLFKLKDKSSENIMNLIAWIKEEIWIKSVTFDNWMEFAKHYMLNDIWIDTYFCNPFSSWEKGSIENLNKLIRRFFPKWTIFDDVPEEKIKSICDILANTPREILGFLSPNQVHFTSM